MRCRSASSFDSQKPVRARRDSATANDHSSGEPPPAAAPILVWVPQKESRLGPFRAGAGASPPYLAGRESEQALFRALLGDLEDGIAPPTEVICYGPRGNGKTALLCWIEDEAADSRVEVVRLTPSAVPTVAQLISRLMPWWKRLAPSQLAAYGISWKLGGGSATLLDRALLARARWRPLMLLLDEAHTLDVEVGRALLNASQQVGRRFPFQLVLAGTPDLETRLNAMSASFWARATQLRIGSLDAEASTAAIGIPLKANGVTLDDGALAHIVGESHGYPWFLQLWGEAVWREAARADRRVTEAGMAAAQARFEERRNLYYRQWLAELEDRGLLAAARAVADAFGERRQLSAAEFRSAVERGIGAAAAPAPAAAQQELRHLGFVWQPGASLDWEPGIPSFMDFAREHIPAV